MPPFPASEYPPGEMLVELTQELDASRENACSPNILQRVAVPAWPTPLGPCTEINVSRLKNYSFVLSQKRSGAEKYVYVAGKRTVRDGARVFKKKSAQSWPRTRKTNRLRPVALHRWIAIFMNGEPPSEHEATHICGNDACIAGAHLRWQKPQVNLDERRWHLEHPPTTTRRGTRSFSRAPWSA